MFIQKILLAIVFFLFTTAAATAGAYFYVSAKITEPFNKFGFNKIFIVSAGESTKQIGGNLFKEGLIEDPFYFRFYLWKTGIKGSIKAGEYYLSSAMNIPEIVDIISKGKIVEQEVSVLIPEGLTVAEMEKILINNGLLKKGEFQAMADGKAPEKYYRYSFLENKPAKANLEGYLFPDTYKFYKKTAPEEILKKMLENFDKRFDAEMRAEADRQGKSIFDILTLASIVQEEASSPQDMKIIAGIFQNRLAIGMALEADSTINFITGKKMPQALFSDLEIDSLYNTYKYSGLPPGPIDNPGLEAIRAVLWPEKTDYLYFLHTPEGRAVYSKTYKEHLKNRAKYL